MRLWRWDADLQYKHAGLVRVYDWITIYRFPIFHDSCERTIRTLHDSGAMVVLYIMLHNLEFGTEANHYLLTRNIMRGLDKLSLYQSPGYSIGNIIYTHLPTLQSRSEGSELITNGRHTGLE